MEPIPKFTPQCFKLAHLTLEAVLWIRMSLILPDPDPHYLYIRIWIRIRNLSSSNENSMENP